MQRQHITGRAPKGSPPPVTRALDSARPVDYLKCLRPDCRTFHRVTRPHAARVGQMYLTHTVRDARAFEGTPVRAGDALIFQVTTDVRAGEVVALALRGKVYVGFLEVEGARWLLTDGDGEPVEGYFEPSAVLPIGRCVEVQRAGRAVEVSLRIEGRRAA